MNRKIVYLMRGLPCCGKSYTARRLAGETGVICETDAFFYTEVGSDPTRYDYDSSLVENARRWSLERFVRAVNEARSPIVVDRGNGRSLYSQAHARYAVEQGYDVALAEPESPWWAEIRVLLKYRTHTAPILDIWAERLAEMGKSTHRTPVADIRRRMDRWQGDVTIEQVLRYEPKREDGDRINAPDQNSSQGDASVVAMMTGPSHRLMLGSREDAAADTITGAQSKFVEREPINSNDLMLFDSDRGEFV